MSKCASRSNDPVSVLYCAGCCRRYSISLGCAFMIYYPHIRLETHLYCTANDFDIFAQMSDLLLKLLVELLIFGIHIRVMRHTWEVVIIASSLLAFLSQRLTAPLSASSM